MNKHTANSLIANSGIHFKSTQIDINPEEALVLPSGRTLKYTFKETINLDDLRIHIDVCSPKDGSFVPVEYLRRHKKYELLPNGLMMLDESGVPRVGKNESLTMMEYYASGDPTLMSINSLSSFRLKDGHDIHAGLELLLGKWLPMPMYELNPTGNSNSYPNGWCRVRIDAMGARRKNGMQTFRLTWAFDTRLAKDREEAKLRPIFLEGNEISKKYTLCNQVDLLLGDFLNIPDGYNDAPVGDYLVSLFGIDLKADEPHKYKFLAYYVYLINYLRLSGAAPEITLYNNEEKTIPVDMSIDIGNSRTCAVLFENGDFTKARMLRIVDMSEPWRSYENAFDMRVVFRRADIGGDITQDKMLFQWPSLVRIGDEAKHLVYRSSEMNGESERTTNYSSPKRYLWDDQPFENHWELMVTDDDPTNVKLNSQVFIEGFTDHFDNDGTFLDKSKELDLLSLGVDNEQCHYSRRSLMTFVMIEVLNHALCYINSSKFRDMHGMIDCRRYLRNIIVTCPTAMPLKEQLALRKSAEDATLLMRKLMPWLPNMSITPSPSKLHPTDDIEEMQRRGWLFDEALASQLVYLYAELAERYDGNVDHFFQVKGHSRKEMDELGFEGNSLTIGTIDIGAGTTDIMVTSYGQKGQGMLTPIPLYYDSFYSAGDDILHNIIRDVILEGPDNQVDTLGSIHSSLSIRLNRMSPDELLTIPRVGETKNYQHTVKEIRNAMSPEIAQNLKSHLIKELMHHFFAGDSANQSDRDRRCRVEFCTQVSHPMSQFFLELLKQGRPPKIYTYDEMFPKEKPATYLLDYFEHHFGFRFETLSWRYDPEQIGAIVRDTMEPLAKALSVVMYALHCDILVLSGRPTNLEPLTELFLKYIPIAPNRLVRLNQYRVGRWFPLATEEGYFQESQKAVVAVGAEVGYLASTVGFNGLVLDFSNLAKTMKSTARFMGVIDDYRHEVRAPFLTPEKNTVMLKGVSVFPYYIGCKQFDSPRYQARPLYAIYNNSSSTQLNIMLQRNYFEDRETLTIEDVTDMEGDTIPTSDVVLRLQTLSNDGYFWMDKGAFKLDIQNN